MSTQPPRLPVPDEVLLRRFGLVRAAGGAAYFVGVAVLLGIFGLEAWPLALGIPVLAVVTTVYYKRSHTYPRAAVAGSLVADALVLGGGVAFLGGTGSGLLMLYGIVVVSAGILLGPVGAYSFTAFTLLLGAAQLGLEELGVEPALLHRPELAERVPILLVSLAGLASIGYLSAIYASRLHDLVALAGEQAASEEERSRRRRSFARQASLDVRGPLARLEELAAALEERERPADEVGVGRAGDDRAGPVDRDRVGAVLASEDRATLAGLLRREITALEGEIGQLADVGVLDLTEVRLEPVRLRRVVDDCLGVLEERLASHDVDVDVAEVKVLADRRAVRRVVANLLENVADHTPAGTHASITTIGDAGHGVLVVSDDGPGIDQTAAAHLFDPPSQVDGSQGSVGLPLVAELCAAMNARIHFEPASHSGGATFLVSFRLAPAAAPSVDDAGGSRLSEA